MKKIFCITILLLTPIFAQADSVDDNILISAEEISGATPSEKYLNLKIEKLRAQIRKNLKSENLRIHMSRLQLLIGHNRQAVQWLRPVVANSNKWQVWFWYGTIALINENFELAQKCLDASIKLSNRKYEAPWIQRAVLEQELSRHRYALGFLSVAESINPNSSAALLDIAYSSDILKMTNLALLSYKRFLKITPVSTNTINIRALVQNRINILSKNKYSY